MENNMKKKTLEKNLEKRERILCDNTWNVLNMQHITPNLKRWDYSGIPSGGT